jgi:hypothetical protein
MDPRDTPTGLPPSADLPWQKRQKEMAGRGLAIFVVGVAIGAFAICGFIFIYGSIVSNQ